VVAAETGGTRCTRLIVFDVEGVLLPKRRFLFFDAAKKLSFWRFLKILVIGLLYEIGLLSLESALRRIFVVYQGFLMDDFLRLFKGLPLMPGVKRVFKTLDEAGYKTALISSGLPTLLVKDLATRLNADYSFGLKIKNSQRPCDRGNRGRRTEAEWKSIRS